MAPRAGEGSEMRESRVHILEAEKRVANSCFRVGQVDKAKKRSSHTGERIGSGGDCGKLAPACSVQGTRRLYQFYLIAPLYKWRLSVVRISNFKSVSLEKN